MCDADECMYEDSSDAEEEEEVEDGLQFSSDEVWLCSVPALGDGVEGSGYLLDNLEHVCMQL